MTTAPAFAAQLNGKVWHNQSAEDVLTQLGSAATGLSATEAARRLAANGPNELKEGAPISPIQLFLAQFKSLIIWILIAAALISGLLGERIDALAILTIAILNAVIGFYQEFKAEKSIAALKQMTSPHATVRRDGQVTSMPASGVVTGDILALAEIFRVLKPGGELYSADFGKLHTALMACVSLVVRWLEEAYEHVKRMNLLKEEFGQRWAYRREGWPCQFFTRWQEQRNWQRLRPFEKFAALIERHWNGIVVYCAPRNKVKLGFVEGLNNKIRVIQGRAYGYRDEEYIRLNILTALLA